MSIEINQQGLGIFFELWATEAFKKMVHSVKKNGHRFEAEEPARRVGSNRPARRSCKNSGNDAQLMREWMQISYADTLDLQRLLKAVKEGNLLSQPVYLGHSGSGQKCMNCGRYIGFSSDGKKIWASTSCAHPRNKAFTTLLNVPSGKLVYAEDLRDAFSASTNYDIEVPYQRMLLSKAFEKIGCAYASIDRFGPDIFRSPKDCNSFIIATVPFGVEKSTGRDIPLDTSPGEFIGSIPSELGSYAFADIDEYFNRGGEDIDVSQIITVEQGVYEFTHMPHKKNGKKTTVIATFKRIRDAEPPKDYLAEFNSIDYTAGQMMAYIMDRDPDRYCDDDAMMRAANYMLMIRHNDSNDWHPSGFGPYYAEMPADYRSVKIPTFNKVYPWSEIQNTSILGLITGAGRRNPSKKFKLNDSYLALARNILSCIIRHGVGEKRRMNKKFFISAEDCLERLNALYPA